MSDIIEEVIVIEGEDLNYFAAVYLVDHEHPRAILRAKFPRDPGLVAFKEAATIDELKATVRGISNQIAKYYGYEMFTIPLPKGLDSEQYLKLLREAKWEAEAGRTGLINFMAFASQN